MYKFKVAKGYKNVKIAELTFNNFKEDKDCIIEFFDFIIRMNGIPTDAETIYAMLKLGICTFINEFDIKLINNKINVYATKETSYLQKIED